MTLVERINMETVTIALLLFAPRDLHLKSLQTVMFWTTFQAVMTALTLEYEKSRESLLVTGARRGKGC